MPPLAIDAPLKTVVDARVAAAPGALLAGAGDAARRALPPGGGAELLELTAPAPAIVARVSADRAEAAIAKPVTVEAATAVTATAEIATAESATAKGATAAILEASAAAPGARPGGGLAARAWRALARAWRRAPPTPPEVLALPAVDAGGCLLYTSPSPRDS